MSNLKIFYLPESKVNLKDIPFEEWTDDLMGEIEDRKIFNESDLCLELLSLSDRISVWLFAEGMTKHIEREIIVTENIQTIIKMIKSRIFEFSDDGFFIQEYECFDDAYKVAKDLKEGNIKCYSE